MKKYCFSVKQFDEIKSLLKSRFHETKDEQKRSRARIRMLGFNISDYFKGFSDKDFEVLLKNGIIKLVDTPKTLNHEKIISISKKVSFGDNSYHKESLPPISDLDTEILILGTMPSNISLTNQQYYNNSRNQFWRIINSIFNNGLPIEDYDKRIDLLKRNKIGLWDVLKSCNREGSSDSAIMNPIANAFGEFFEKHTKINTLIFNGKDSLSYYIQFINQSFNKSLIQLNSTSSLNTHKKLDQKIEEWGRYLRRH